MFLNDFRGLAKNKNIVIILPTNRIKWKQITDASHLNNLQL